MEMRVLSGMRRGRGVIGNSEFDIPGVLLSRVERQRLCVYERQEVYSSECVSDRLSGSITDASSSRRGCVIFLSAKRKCSQSAVVLSYCIMYP